MDTLGKRLKTAREAKKLSQAELAKKAGVTTGAIGNIEAESRKNPRDLLSIAAALGVSPHWLQTGQGSMGDHVLHIEAGSYVLSGNALDRLVRLDKRTVPPTRTRGEIVNGQAGEVYAFQLDDDALAPDMPRGTELVFDVAKQPNPGSVVLVLDSHGELHAREYRQDPAGWVAAAVNRAYASFSSSDVRLLAVATYKALP